MNEELGEGADRKKNKRGKRINSETQRERNRNQVFQDN